jgi:hypothetical protein
MFGLAKKSEVLALEQSLHSANTEIARLSELNAQLTEQVKSNMIDIQLLMQFAMKNPEFETHCEDVVINDEIERLTQGEE